MRHIRAVSLAVFTIAVVACGSGGSGGSGTPAGPGSTAGSGIGANGPTLGAKCTKAGEQTGIPNGTAICLADATGVLHWQSYNPNNPNSNGNTGNSSPNNQQEPVTNQMRVGTQCSKDGSFGFGDGMITVCDKGTARYALPDEVPPAPSGGYTSRPDWYPTLAQIFGPKVDECPNGKVTFGAPFLPLDHITRTEPAGLMIGDHVTPIDHMYVGIDTLERPQSSLTDADYLPLTAPADGWIVDAGALGDPSSHRVVIVHGCGVVSVYMVVNRLSGVLASIGNSGRLETPVQVKQGDEFGRQRDNPLDFNTFDAHTWLTGFANPFSYADGEPWKPYFSDPSALFTPAIWKSLEASMQRTAAPRWGIIDRDVVGSAAGNWFLDGTIGYNGVPIDTVRAATSQLQGGQVPGKAIYSWGHLSLSPHPVDPTAWIFSTGSWTSLAGDAQQLLLVPGSAPPPDKLTAASGVVVYRLTTQQVNQPNGFTMPAGTKAPLGIGYTVTAGKTTEGWVVVQVIDDMHLAIEVVHGAKQPSGFSSAKQTYHR